ncbi:MAG: tetratricopeptide repeat protein [Gemmatimonadaceae bacterium]|nr:tetratricopeptide repeat protein [Gemmatimonadaceae bacterium]
MTPARAMRRVREDPLGASSYIEKGWHLIAVADYERAEAILAKALTLAASDNQARALLGWAQMRQGKYDHALRELEDVLAADPLCAVARASLGYVCLRKGLIREAEDHLTRSAQQVRDPSAALNACFYLGLLHTSLRKVHEAQRCFEKSVSLAPNFIEAYYELGRLHWTVGEKREAEKAWREGQAANRFNIWGRRCAEALRQVRSGEEPGCFS